jgi:hypothetical protein
MAPQDTLEAEQNGPLPNLRKTQRVLATSSAFRELSSLLRRCWDDEISARADSGHLEP